MVRGFAACSGSVGYAGESWARGERRGKKERSEVEKEKRVKDAGKDSEGGDV